MKLCIKAFVYLSVLSQCFGFLGSIHDAITGAGKRIHDGVHGVATSVAGGFNFGGHLSANTQSSGFLNVLNPFGRPQARPPQYQPDDDQEPHQGNYYDRPHGNQNGQHYNENQGENGYNQDVPMPPNQNNNRPSTVKIPDNQYNNHQNNPHQEPDRDVKKSTESPIEHKKPTFGTTQQTKEPNLLVTTMIPGTTGKFPLFLPLTPDQYVYEGDKIISSAPKRETEKEENYDIDIRTSE